MAITLEEATEATDLALKQCIDEINEDQSTDSREKARLIDIMLETRQKSIDSLMNMSSSEEEKLRAIQKQRTAITIRVLKGTDIDLNK